MGMLSFFKEAGEKLFHTGAAKAAVETAAAAPSVDNVAVANQAASDAIASYMSTMNLNIDGLKVEADPAAGAVTLYGQAATQQDKEKAVLCAGNVHGVERVNDLIAVTEDADEAQYYTVVSGDTLSKISKAFYEDANKYMAIFEANKPMLSHPDKIYPGQMLRIPGEA
jgi:nucleoid-associated protein YgaU